MAKIDSLDAWLLARMAVVLRSLPDADLRTLRAHGRRLMPAYHDRVQEKTRLDGVSRSCSSVSRSTWSGCRLN